MDVMTTLAVQKLGRLMLRITAATAAVAFSNRMEGSPSSPSYSPATEPYSGDAGVGGTASNDSGPPESRCLERRGSNSLMGPRRADACSATSIHSPAAILERATFMSRSFFSPPSERDEGVLTDSCVGRAVSSRPSIISGRQGNPISLPKIYLRQANAFAPDHVMRRRFPAEWRSRRQQARVWPQWPWRAPSCSRSMLLRLLALRATRQPTQLSRDWWGSLPRTRSAPRCYYGALEPMGRTVNGDVHNALSCRGNQADSAGCAHPALKPRLAAPPAQPCLRR